MLWEKALKPQYMALQLVRSIEVIIAPTQYLWRLPFFIHYSPPTWWCSFEGTTWGVGLWAIFINIFMVQQNVNIGFGQDAPSC